MRTLLVVLGVILMLGGALYIVYPFLRRRSAQRASLKAVVTIEPSGETRVEWTPDATANGVRKMKLAVQYLAKIGFVLDSGDEEVRQMFRQLLDSLVGNSDHEDDGNFFEQLDHISHVIQASNSEGFYPTTDIFVIDLVEGGATDYVVNDLPRPGLAINIPVSVFAVLNDVASSLTTASNRMFFRSIVQKLVQEMNSIESMGFGDLKYLAQSTSRSFEELSGILTER